MSSPLEKVFGLWDYVVFIALLVSSTFIGVYFAWAGRHAKSSEHFFTGGRKLAVFPVTMSLIASFMSTNTLLGVPAEVFQIGTQFALQTISICLVIVVTAEVFMPVYFNLGITSVNEYLQRRFNSDRVKTAGAVGFLLATMPYMAVVLYGPAIALSSVIRISIPMSILVVGVIVTFYTSIGGIKAVIWTDVLQCMLMFIGVLLVVVEGLIDLGGFSNIVRINQEGGRLKIFNMKFDLYNHDNFWNVVLGMLVTWGATYCAKQTQVQRYLSMRSPAHARRTLYYNLPGLLLLALLSIFCGMIIYAKYHACDPVTLGLVDRHDQIIPYYVMDTLSGYPGVPGLFVASAFSGSLSTLSSGFNAQAAVFWEDFLRHRIALSPGASVRAVKLIAVAFGAIAILMSFGVGSIGTVLQAGISLAGAVNGPLFGMFTMGLLLRFVNEKGALAGFAVGLAVSATMSLGSIALPRPKIAMATSVEGCPLKEAAHLAAYYLVKANQSAAEQSVPKFIPYYEHPEGIAKFLHISYMLLSLVGFLTCIVVGCLVSWLTYGAVENEHLDERLLSKWARLFPPYKKKKKLKIKASSNASRRTVSEASTDQGGVVKAAVSSPFRQTSLEPGGGGGGGGKSKITLNQLEMTAVC